MTTTREKEHKSSFLSFGVDDAVFCLFEKDKLYSHLFSCFVFPFACTTIHPARACDVCARSNAAHKTQQFEFLSATFHFDF